MLFYSVCIRVLPFLWLLLFVGSFVCRFFPAMTFHFLPRCVLSVCVCSMFVWIFGGLFFSIYIFSFFLCILPSHSTAISTRAMTFFLVAFAGRLRLLFSRALNVFAHLPTAPLLLPPPTTGVSYTDPAVCFCGCVFLSSPGSETRLFLPRATLRKVVDWRRQSRSISCSRFAAAFFYIYIAFPLFLSITKSLSWAGGGRRVVCLLFCCCCCCLLLSQLHARKGAQSAFDSRSAAGLHGRSTRRQTVAARSLTRSFIL